MSYTFWIFHSLSIRCQREPPKEIVNMCFICIRLISVPTIRIYLNNYVAVALTTNYTLVLIVHASTV